jgi:ataxia telangiectasia mutated family protein
MEQLFGLVNTLLQDNPETQKRRLGVRTYKVIPFTPSAGVLEWVDGTVPLLEYLLGSTRAGGAHGRYGAGDWTFMACREHMSTVSGVFTPIQKYTLLDTHFSICARDYSGCKNSICD